MYLYKQKVWKKGKKSSGTLLAEAIGIPTVTPNTQIKTEGQRMSLQNNTIINWGCSTSSDVTTVAHNTLLNKPECVKIAVNKLKALSILEENCLPVPMFTTTYDGAIRLLSGYGGVVCRTLLTSHSGKGIILAKKEEDIVDAKLYTAYYKKTAEYRVHVFNRNTLLVKKRKLSKEKLAEKGIEDEPKFVRNLGSGFIYSTRTDDISPETQERLVSIAISAVEAIGLDFGAVDIMETEDNSLLILEVNTAPGLSNQSTFHFYKDNIDTISRTDYYPNHILTEPL